MHAVVADRELAALGFDRYAVRRRLSVGRLHRLYPGVYAVGHTVLSVAGRYRAAVLACGRGAVLSHRSAAAHWGLMPAAAGRCVDVTVPFSSGVRSRAGIRVHRSRKPVEATTRDAIPVTTPARTLADVAEALSRRALEKAVEQAHALRLLDAREVAAVARAHRGRAGPARLARLLREHDVEQTTRSPLEDAFLELCDAHDIERPVVNARVEGLEVDFHWPRARLIVEADGRRHHRTAAAFERDRARDALLTAAGWRVVRFTDRQVRAAPGAVAGLLRRLLGDL
jgi:very-short-patch-repair endonuclease